MSLSLFLTDTVQKGAKGTLRAFRGLISTHEIVGSPTRSHQEFSVVPASDLGVNCSSISGSYRQRLVPILFLAKTHLFEFRESRCSESEKQGCTRLWQERFMAQPASDAGKAGRMHASWCLQSGRSDYRGRGDSRQQAWS